MILVRAATAEEIRGLTDDPLTPTCPSKWALEKDGKLIAFAGVNVPSLTSQDGWPWLRFINRSLLSNREIVTLARKALEVWSRDYPVLRACAEEGENTAWFRFLGFRVDSRLKPLYADGKTMVFMRYEHGQQ